MGKNICVESSRVRQGIESVKYALSEIWLMDVYGQQIDDKSVSKALNKAYEYVAKCEGKYHDKDSIDKASVASKLITQTFKNSQELIDALRAYYETDGKDRTIEIEMLNNVSKRSKLSSIIDSDYLRKEFREIRNLYGLNA